jgi:ParB-like chromosome segregation protein Spo0J
MIDIQEIPPERIDNHSPNVRRVLDETGSLAQSMEAHGQLEPGTGWWDEDRFRIATGHRRGPGLPPSGNPPSSPA